MGTPLRWQARSNASFRRWHFTKGTNLMANLMPTKSVWCDFAEREAELAFGFCEFCGSSAHVLMDFPDHG